MITQSRRQAWVLLGAAIVAIVFGSLTIFSGGRVLFGDAIVRQAAGDVVPFVLWFNFAAGFAYVVAGIGLIARQVWGTGLAAIILLATIVIFIALALHIAQGSAFEMRTVAAMTIRTAIWLAITAIAIRRIGWR